MNTCFTLILTIVAGLVRGDSIEPDKGTEKNTEETENVKLSCSYSTNSEYVLLYWYRQYLNGEPQYLLRNPARSSASVYEHTSDIRYQGTTSRSSTELTITNARLSDSALYYCALRVVVGLGTADPLTFGAPIRLTVNPKEVSNAPPAFLSVLSPVKESDPRQPGPDICVAAGFFPAKNTMTLTLKSGNPVQKDTSDAALSLSSKNYYYVGWSSEKIQKCEMDGKTANADKIDEPSGDPGEGDVNKTATLDCQTNIPTPPSTNNDEPKTNSMTLLVTGLRILLAKCVAVNVMMSVKAFLV